jgi:RNA polymerase sigma factor (sigma-70 family)
MARQMRTGPEAGATDSLEAAQDAPDPLEVSIGLEERQAVHECIAALGSPCRELVRLLFEERSYDEIALELGIPRGSIGPSRGRCLARLARLLEQRGLE